MRKLTTISSLLLSFLGGISLQAQPEPKIKYVLVISIDGMHAQDLAKWVESHPNSTLAHLQATGGHYTNAYTTRPSDSIPSTVGIFTGASPSLGGMYYDDAWHRAFSPSHSASVAAGKPDCSTTGTLIDLKDGIDLTPPARPASAILDLNKLPRDPANGCAVIYPHNMLRVNPVFEVVRAAGMRTAYSEKRPAYDFLNGPSGT